MFRNRTEAGERLAEALVALAIPDPVVLALPRGGVPVALPVARALNAPLDLLLVRKIGCPGNPELAAGAVVEGRPPVVVWNRDVLAGYGLAEADLAGALEARLAEIAARRAAWLAGRAAVPLAGRSAIVVDDGIATGATVRAALQGLAAQGPGAVILAVPVAPPDTLAALAPLCSRIVCLERPVPFSAVGRHYADFAQVADAEVAGMLAARPAGGE